MKAQNQKKHSLLFLFISLVLLSIPNLMLSQVDACKTTRNFYSGDGGSSEADKVTSSNGGKTIVMKTGFETITFKLGSIPESTAEFKIINYTSEPAEDEISIKNYTDSGNEPETIEVAESDKTAFICNSNGKITITWKDVKFKHTANSKTTFKSNGEVSSSVPKPKTASDPSAASGTNSATNANNTSNTTTDPAVTTATLSDPDAQLKTDIANYEAQLNEQTKNVTAKEIELKEKKSKKQIDSVDAVIAKYDIDILKQKRDETKFALERSTKTLNKKLSVTEKQDYIAKEEQCKLKAKSLETEKTKLVELKTLNTTSKKAVADLPAQISKQEADIKATTPKTTMDSLNLKVKQIELERTILELDKSKVVEERTSKLLRGKPDDKKIQEYTAKENSCQQKINDCNTRIAEQQKLIKGEKKQERKDNRNAKVDSMKAKVRLKLVDKNISSTEKDIEKYKKKNEAEKLTKAEKELVDLKKEQADLQKEIAGYEAQLNSK